MDDDVGARERASFGEVLLHAELDDGAPGLAA
jgi:hypothetical protein